MKEWLDYWEQRIEDKKDLEMVEDFFVSLHIAETFKFDTTIPLVDQHVKRMGFIIRHFSDNMEGDPQVK